MKHLSKRGARRLLRCTGRLLMQVALLLWYPELPLLAGDELLCFRFVETQKQPVPHWHCALWMPSAIPKELSSLFSLFSLLCDCYCVYYHISFHSHSWCFPYWQPPLDKCVYGIIHVYKSLHKLLSKINKRRAERGGGKNEGQDRKNIEREPYVMLERPLRVLSIFPSIFSGRPVYAIIKKGTLPCLFIIRTHGWQLPVNKSCVYMCACACTYAHCSSFHNTHSQMQGLSVRYLLKWMAVAQ